MKDIFKRNLKKDKRKKDSKKIFVMIDLSMNKKGNILPNRILKKIILLIYLILKKDLKMVTSLIYLTLKKMILISWNFLKKKIK